MIDTIIINIHIITITIKHRTSNSNNNSNHHTRNTHQKQANAGVVRRSGRLQLGRAGHRGPPLCAVLGFGSQEGRGIRRLRRSGRVSFEFFWRKFLGVAWDVVFFFFFFHGDGVEHFYLFFLGGGRFCGVAWMRCCFSPRAGFLLGLVPCGGFQRDLQEEFQMFAQKKATREAFKKQLRAWFVAVYRKCLWRCETQRRLFMQQMWDHV